MGGRREGRKGSHTRSLGLALQCVTIYWYVHKFQARSTGRKNQSVISRPVSLITGVPPCRNQFMLGLQCR